MKTNLAIIIRAWEVLIIELPLSTLVGKSQDLCQSVLVGSASLDCFPQDSCFFLGVCLDNCQVEGIRNKFIIQSLEFPRSVHGISIPIVTEENRILQGQVLICISPVICFILVCRKSVLSSKRLEDSEHLQKQGGQKPDSHQQPSCAAVLLLTIENPAVELESKL